LYYFFNEDMPPRKTLLAVESSDEEEEGPIVQKVPLQKTAFQGTTRFPLYGGITSQILDVDQLSSSAFERHTAVFETHNIMKEDKEIMTVIDGISDLEEEEIYDESEDEAVLELEARLMKQGQPPVTCLRMPDETFSRREDNWDEDKRHPSMTSEANIISLDNMEASWGRLVERIQQEMQENLARLQDVERIIQDKKALL
jgi:hypothetical protein